MPAVGAPLLVALSTDVRSEAAGVLSTEPAGEIDFSSIAAGTRAERTIRLRSHGNAAITIGVATLTGPDRARFELAGDCSNGLVLPPGAACGLVLSYRPAVAGAARASLQWRSDGLNPGNLALGGLAPAAEAPSPPPAPPAAPGIDGGGGGGGCSLAAPARPASPARETVDPLLRLLAALSGWCLWWRRGNRSRAG